MNLSAAVGLLAAGSNAVGAFSALPASSPRAVLRRIGADVVPCESTRRGADCDSAARRASLQEIGAACLAAAALAPPSPANAKDAPPPPDRATVTAVFDAVRFELTDPQGGVAVMQQRIDARDFEGLMEFTKGYDLELRKLKMGKAKKLLQDKDVKQKATEYANSVTFDLIGINRASRPGQENTDNANKYLEELRHDIASFLSLEETVAVIDE